MSGTEDDWLVRDEAELLTPGQQDLLDEWDEQFDINVSPKAATVLFEMDYGSWDDSCIKNFFSAFDGLDRDEMRAELGLDEEDADGSE
mgnify:CR=1 FL=1